MLDIGMIITMLSEKSAILFVILQCLGALVVVAAAYVQLTPSPKDNELLAKIEAMPVIGAILKTVIRFSPIERKK